MRLGDRSTWRRARGGQFGLMALKIGRGASAPPFIVMDVITAANARAASLPPGAPRVIRMEVGQPGTGAPQGAVAAAAAALRSGSALGYTEAFGLPSLRARIARHYADWYGVAVSARARRGHGGRFGRLPARLSGRLRPRRPGRARRPVLPALRQRPHGARPRAGLDGMPTPPRGSSPRSRCSTAGPPPRRPDRREPVQPRRHHAASRRIRRRSRAGAGHRACG